MVDRTRTKTQVWTVPHVNEALARLYLRLAGYFTTGLVIHAAVQGQQRTEIDCLAVRHPYHCQLDRVVGPPPFLGDFGIETDLIICEVKTNAKEIRFNKALAESNDAISKVINWAGVLPEAETRIVIPLVAELLKPGKSIVAARSGVTTGGVRIRALLCSPVATPTEIGEAWILTSDEIFRYAQECFNPDKHRPNCADRYDFCLWGSELSPVVEYFKNLARGQRASLQGLYRKLGETD